MVEEIRRRALGTVGYVDYPGDRRSYIRIGDRLLPPWADVVMPGGGGQPELKLRLEVVNFVPQCRAVHVTSHADGREVKPADLKAIHVTEVMEEIYAAISVRIVSESGEHITVAEEWGDRAQGEAVQAIAAARRGRHGRKITPAFLEEVAKIYRDNINNNPTQAVQRAFDVSRRMAAEYVSRARAEGLLPPTTPGKKQA